MVLTDTAINTLRDLAWQLEAADAVVKIPRFPLYVADDRTAFLDLGLGELRGLGLAEQARLQLRQGHGVGAARPTAGRPAHRPPDWSCIELKFLDADEFDHWSDTDFETTARTQRKRREWEVFRALADGGEPPEDVVPVEAPDGAHVIDYVRSVWLPQKESDPGDLAERILRQLVRL